MRWPSWLLLTIAGFLTPMIFAFVPSPGPKIPVASPTEQAVREASPADDRTAALRRMQEAQLAQLDEMITARRQLLADLENIADLVPEQYRMLVIEVARHEGLEPRVLASVGWVESRWDPQAAGSSGEIGIGQILPSTADWIASRMGLQEYDLWDPETNVRMAAWYLRVLIEDEGSLEAALAAYNGGPRAMDRKPMSARSYIDRIRTAGQEGR